ncbi:MAG: hypothetical protein SGPRY_010993 [Prymnesium sp.]
MDASPPHPSSRPRSHSATRSTCGTQVLSQRASSPSFSFGTAPARLALQSARPTRHMVLQASVSEMPSTPGPIYNPIVAKKWLGDAPTASFGQGKQRSVTPELSPPICRFTGKSTMPGPGAYATRSSMGPQPLTRCASAAAFSFGTGKQHGSISTFSPGPVYVIPSKITKTGPASKVSFAFGEQARGTCFLAAPSSAPGPGMYNLRSSLGLQVHC